MADNSRYDGLSQIDNCLSRYYKANMAPTLKKEKDHYETEQQKEYFAAVDAESRRSKGLLERLGEAVRDSHGVTVDVAKLKVDAVGKWNTKTLDDLFADVKLQWAKDTRLQADIKTIKEEFYKALCKAKGVSCSAQLMQYADNYVNKRITSLMVEQLAQLKVPKSSAEYIVKKAWNESLLGLFTPDYGMKGGAVGESVAEKTEEIYQPSRIEKGTAFVASAIADAAATGGVGGGTVLKAGAKKGLQVGLDVGIRASLSAYGQHNWSNENYVRSDSKKILGNENAYKTIQDNGAKYNRIASNAAVELNKRLHYKIKLPPKTTDQRKNDEISSVDKSVRSHSGKLLEKIKSSFSLQAVAYRENDALPSWMLTKSAAENRALALQFYGLAMDMSKYGKAKIVVGKKTMTFAEVSQRAYDYARAAVEVDHRSAKTVHNAKAKPVSTSPSEKEMKTNFNSPQQMFANSPYAAMIQSASTGTQHPSLQQPTSQMPASAQPLPTSGWDNLLDNLGISGFSDITKNLGYVIAMLPDMMIGMFTGKNPNMKLDDHLMPLAAIVGGMFVRNPILKILLMGYGGASLFKSAGNAALGQATGKTNRIAKSFKQYDDEPLNKRVINPAIKGDTMLCNIDGKPLAIRIASADALDAYEQGSLPLNTLANAILRRYDVDNASLAHSYALQQRDMEEQRMQRGIR